MVMEAAQSGRNFITIAHYYFTFGILPGLRMDCRCYYNNKIIMIVMIMIIIVIISTTSGNIIKNKHLTYLV